jgi:cytochrome b561
MPNPLEILRRLRALNRSGVAKAQRSQAAAIEKHPRAAIVLHWSTAIAIVISIAAIYLRGATEDKLLRQALLDIHRQLGLFVLICVPLRHLVRGWIGHANPTAEMSAWVRRVAALTHWTLYSLLIGLPLLGWAATSAHSVDLRLFGLLPLPSLSPPDSDLADQLTDYHAWGAYALMALVGLHALAALWHHFVLRDPVLRAMLPGRRVRS